MATERVRLSLSPDVLRDRRFVLRGIRRAMRRSLEKSARMLEREIRRQAPVDTGKLSRSIRVVKKTVTEGEQAEISMRLYGVFQSKGYGGRGKFPPPGVLRGWVRRKLGIADIKEARQVEFLVARKIATKGAPGRGGMRPNRFVERAIQKLGPELRRSFRREVERLRLRKQA